MNRTARSQTSLFLIELILAILFFSLGSSICIRVFAQASLMSRSAADLSFASSQVSGAAAAHDSPVDLDLRLLDPLNQRSHPHLSCYEGTVPLSH